MSKKPPQVCQLVGGGGELLFRDFEHRGVNLVVFDALTSPKLVLKDFKPLPMDALRLNDSLRVKRVAQT